MKNGGHLAAIFSFPDKAPGAGFIPPRRAVQYTVTPGAGGARPSASSPLCRITVSVAG